MWNSVHSNVPHNDTDTVRTVLDVHHARLTCRSWPVCKIASGIGFDERVYGTRLDTSLDFIGRNTYSVTGSSQHYMGKS